MFELTVDHRVELGVEAFDPVEEERDSKVPASATPAGAAGAAPASLLSGAFSDMAAWNGYVPENDINGQDT